MTTAHAGVMGWFTSEVRDWEFIQKTGGLRVLAPVKREGKLLLPVEYDVSGLTTITTKPIMMNSGQSVRKIDCKREGTAILIVVKTQIAEKGVSAEPLHYADLDGAPPGTYKVFYGAPYVPADGLGVIEIKQ
ncbi:hypothetical protein L4X63_23485 [Geomonas sp. Red32]|uniref:hypothetical protein n=1 Tax=Geomonas sp. Red32 TaxID=2912856 RepID=UPI00202CECFA|nr:hypothetical protein [Geomonas sp. Red32]MCM0084541.1 hypothetical protein [Geomonas sp. Red32]